jgi:glycosyltransferase involved in cell wall biosynthesis
MKINKNILIVSCVFPPETVVSAKTSYDIAKKFSTDGYLVDVICPTPSRNVDLGSSVEKNIGIRIINLKTLNSNSSSFISRFFENISFGLLAFIKIIISKKYDAVYVNVWPIFAVGFVGLACKIRNLKVISVVQDLYPESLVAQKRIKEGGFVYQILFFLDKLSVSFMSKILVISPSFKNSYVKIRGVEEGKVVLFNNWMNSSSFSGLDVKKARQLLSDRYEVILGDDFVTVYGGNIGVASGIYEYIKRWSKLDERGVFLLAGAGSELDKIRNFIKLNNMESTFHIMSPWPDDASEAVLSSADVLALPIAEGQESASLPSKMISYMYSARPILMLTDSNSLPAKVLIDSSSGFVVDHTDNLQLAYSKITLLHKDEMTALGVNGRSYAEENYSFGPNFCKIKKAMLDE